MRFTQPHRCVSPKRRTSVTSNATLSSKLAGSEILIPSEQPHPRCPRRIHRRKRPAHRTARIYRPQTPSPFIEPNGRITGNPEIIDSQFLVCRQAGRNYSRGHLALAIAELVDTEFFDPKLNGRSGETELFRGAVFPRYSAPRFGKGILNRLPFF